MHHQIPPNSSPVSTVRFRPYEDVLGVGHGTGVSSCVIPGSGDAQYDTLEYNLNPAADKKQRREDEVRALLEKLPPDTITLDVAGTGADSGGIGGVGGAIVGGIEPSNPHYRREKLQDIAEAANEAAANAKPIKKKRKQRGKSKIQTILRRKHKNIIDQQTILLREARSAAEASAVENSNKGSRTSDSNEHEIAPPAALKRFF
jgi:U3 small nucleolar RNA-associated protein 7